MSTVERLVKALNQEPIRHLSGETMAILAEIEGERVA